MTSSSFIPDSQGHPTIIKDPAAVLDYVVDWTKWLGVVSGGDTIATFTVTVDDGLTLNSSALTTDSKGVTMWLEGGTPGQTYRAHCKIVTVGDRTDERDVFFKIKER